MKPLKAITSTDIFGGRSLDVGQVIEVYDSCGNVKVTAKIVSKEAVTTFTVRGLYWYEWLWRVAVMRYRIMRDWLREKLARNHSTGMS